MRGDINIFPLAQLPTLNITVQWQLSVYFVVMYSFVQLSYCALYESFSD